MPMPNVDDDIQRKGEQKEDKFIYRDCRQLLLRPVSIFRLTRAFKVNPELT
jgi:hypothetical protein